MMAENRTKKRIKMTPQICDWDNQVGGRAILPERKYRRRSESGVKGSKFYFCKVELGMRVEHLGGVPKKQKNTQAWSQRKESLGRLAKELILKVSLVPCVLASVVSNFL